MSGEDPKYAPEYPFNYDLILPFSPTPNISLDPTIPHSTHQADGAKNNNRVRTLFQNKDLTFSTASSTAPTTWKIETPLDAEKEWSAVSENTWVSAVFACSRVIEEGEIDDAEANIPAEAVCKIFMVYPTPSPRPWKAKSEDAALQLIANEVCALKRMAQLGDRNPSPKVYAVTRFVQSADMWVEGGLVCMILMEKLAGVSLDDPFYWNLTREERDGIRGAFIESESRLREAGVQHGDHGLRNLIWNEKTGICHIIDFEIVSLLPGERKQKSPLPEDCDSIWEIWGLKLTKTKWNDGY